MRITKALGLLVAVAMVVPTGIAVSSSIERTLKNFGDAMEWFNLGMATSLLSNIDLSQNSDTSCIIAAKVTSDEIFKLLDFAGYLNGGFNLGVFMESINVVNMKMQYQFEQCGVRELFIKWDNLMSHVSDVCGTVVNLAVAIGTGWTNKDTYPFKFYDITVLAYANSNWLQWGQAMQLLFAQLVKFDAADIVIEAEPVE